MRKRSWLLGLVGMAWALGLLGCGQTVAGGPVLVAEGFESPCGLGFDGRGRLYLAEAATGRVLVLGQGGERTVLAEGIEQLAGLAVDRDNRVYVVSRSRGEVLRIDPRGERTVVVSGLSEPQGLLAERFGGLLIFEGARGRMLRRDRDGSLREVLNHQALPETGVRMISTPANPGAERFSGPGGAPGPGAGFGVSGPLLAVAWSGAVYGVDLETHCIRARVGGSSRRIQLPDDQDVTGLGCDRDGALFFCTRQGRVYRLPGWGA